MKKILISYVLLLSFFQSLVLFANNFEKKASSETIASEEGLEEGLEELMLEIPVKVTSLTEISIKKAPGIVTLITSHEIMNSGARDLIDVLKLVPGFSFAYDVQNITSVGFRGNWGQEGKILLIVDGNENNDILYSNLEFGNHYPVDIIDKIEIMRGPGSAIYGGNAEIAVINIITKNHGNELTAQVGKMKDGFPRTNMSFLYEPIHNTDFNISLSGYFSKALRSDRKAFDQAYNTYYEMTDLGTSKEKFIDLNIRYKNWGVSFIFDNFSQESMFWGDIGNQNFRSYYFNTKYDWNISDNIKITPKVSIKEQSPWLLSIDPRGIKAGRYLFNLTSIFTITDKTQILFGGETFLDKAVVDKHDETWFVNGKNNITYKNNAIFGQSIIGFDTIGTLTLGARYDKHEQYGSSLVPRICLTKDIDNFYTKLLYSKAFRAPNIRNLDGDPNIKPEETNTAEIEMGYRFKNSSLSFNVYDIVTHKSIQFFFIPENDGYYYRNFDKTGTRGIESELRTIFSWGYVNYGYSFYKVNDNRVPAYTIPDEKDLLLAFPAHKFTLNSSIKAYKNISINPSLVYESKKFGKTLDDSGNEIFYKEEPLLLINLNIIRKNLFFEDMNLSLSVFNILNKEENLPNPYDIFSKIPGPSREVLLKITYNF